MTFRLRLKDFNNKWYSPGGSLVKRILWYIINQIFFKSGFVFPSSFKRFLLKKFGAKIGLGVIIKPHVNIKYPWHLEIGDYSWIGEQVWIDNLTKVKIGSNVCISQGALLLCGNHNYKTETFDLFVKPIYIEDGVWIGAKSVVCPGVKCLSHAILTVGSIATKDLDAYQVYQGNPAVMIKSRL